MLEVIQGDLPLPRVTRPFEEGLGGSSTTPEPDRGQQRRDALPRRPASWPRGRTGSVRRGPSASPGTMLFTVVGDVESPGTYELALGTPLRTLLVDIAGARDIKVVAPGRQQRADHARDARHAARLRRDARGRDRPRLGRVRRLRHLAVASSTCWRSSSTSSPSSPAGSATPASSATARWTRSWHAVQRGEATQTDLETDAASARTPSPTRTAATCRSGPRRWSARAVQAFVDEFVATVEAGEPTPADLPDAADRAHRRGDRRGHLPRALPPQASRLVLRRPGPGERSGWPRSATSPRRAATPDATGAVDRAQSDSSARGRRVGARAGAGDRGHVRRRSGQRRAPARPRRWRGARRTSRRSGRARWASKPGGERVARADGVDHLDVLARRPRRGPRRSDARRRRRRRG